MATKRINIGIIGLKPGESWAGVAHYPALKLLSEQYIIAGVANRNLESSLAVAKELGIPHAFANASELIDSPEIDAVTVTITVPQHLAVVRSALEVGKPVYCEAPLGNGLAEAKMMAGQAREKGCLAVVGLQARVAPEILYLRQLIGDGYIGTVLSSSIAGWAGNWGPTAGNLKRLGYLLDKKNGATMLTIPLGHTLAAVQDVLGGITEVSALIDTRMTQVRSEDDGSMIPMTAPDQILLNARVANGVPLSIHYQGGMPNGIEGFTWDIHGTKGDIRISAPFGHSQMAQLSLLRAQTGSGILSPIEVPEKYYAGIHAEPVPGNVARNYLRLAHDIRTGERTASTFEDAVCVQQLIDVIEKSAASGQRLSLASTNRPIPLP